MRVIAAVLTFAFVFDVVAPLIFPYCCVGGLRTGQWITEGPGGTYGFVRYLGADFVHLGLLGQVSLNLLKRGAFSMLIALMAAALIGDIGIRRRCKCEHMQPK